MQLLSHLVEADVPREYDTFDIFSHNIIIFAEKINIDKCVR